MKTNTKWHVYALSDPRTREVRYVGWTINTRARLNAHCCTAKGGGDYRAHWIASLLAEGVRPAMTVLETGTGDWAEAERRWIASYRLAGARLTNLTDGGEGTPGCIPDENVRRKMSAAHTGRKQTPESIAKTRAALLGRKQSPEHLARLSQARKGRAPLPATAAAALANRGRKQSPEHVAKRMAAHIGKPRPSQRRLTADQVRTIRREAGRRSLRNLAAEFGVGQTTIHGVIRGTAYQDVSPPE